MLERSLFFNRIKENFNIHSVTALLGPRQCGKTTLAKQYAEHVKGLVTLFDLEDPTHLLRLETPKLALENLEGLIVIDEIQRRPDLFSYLRVLVDQYPERRYLILGSASRDLIQQSSETLAGRIGYIELTPFQLGETTDLLKLWHRGGFPKSYLASSERASMTWRKSYITTFLERDIPSLGINIPASDLRRLWTMLAHYHGNTINYSELGRSLGLTDNTIRRYIQVLEGTFMIRQLKPWHANISKRQIKSPKVYIRDSGLLHALLNIEEKEISLDPKVGASWEGFALEEVIHKYQVDTQECYFWATAGHAELDLLLMQGLKRSGFEFKYTDTPRPTKSMHIALENLELDQLTVVVPMNCDFYIHEKIRVQGLENLVL